MAIEERNEQTFATRQIHAGAVVDSDVGARVTPIYQSAGYVFRRTTRRRRGSLVRASGAPTREATTPRMSWLASASRTSRAAATGSSCRAGRRPSP
ncbi:hypothetical protein ACFPRL_32940 [Pseudoclavibacter helvolus]